MTYNNNGNHYSNPSIGAPGSGFASRGKGGHIKRISVAGLNKANGAPDGSLNSAQLPRTARSHLLAGLRTAPKTPAVVPASAPYHQTQYRGGLDTSYYAANNNTARFGYEMPQTAAAAGFGNIYGQQQQQHQQMYDLNNLAALQGGYASADQLFAAQQALNLGYANPDQFDPEFYDELLHTNMFLAQRKQQLEQQLMSVTVAAQQQLQNMNLNGSPPTPLSPQASGYGQQQQQQQQQSMYGSYSNHVESTRTGFTPVHRSASRSPPKLNELASPATATTASGNAPQSPGYRRAGEHPTRQPRGPPPMEELMAKPTAKFDGTKNFALRQRRRAVHSLVRAGVERRSVLPHGLMEEFAY